MVFGFPCVILTVGVEGDLMFVMFAVTIKCGEVTVMAMVMQEVITIWSYRSHCAGGGGKSL